jgi:hypothetical protein
MIRLLHLLSDSGGGDKVGLIFWYDYADNVRSERAWRVPQVFSPTASRRSHPARARGLTLTLINVNVRMCKVYGGHTVYLEITADGESADHSQHGTRWSRKVLGPAQVPQ